jgi:hypothetical protein
MDVVVQQDRVRTDKVCNQDPLKDCLEPIEMHEQKHQIRNADSEENQNVRKEGNVRSMSDDTSGPRYIRLEYMCANPIRKFGIVTACKHNELKMCTVWV